MKVFGKKRTIKVDTNYTQLKELGDFWEEMKNLYPNESLIGLGTNWTTDTLDYYIGKIDEKWSGGTITINVPDEGWHEFSCRDNDQEIEKMYRKVYTQGTPDYEIESINNGIFTSKVHFADKGNSR